MGKLQATGVICDNILRFAYPLDHLTHLCRFQRKLEGHLVSVVRYITRKLIEFAKPRDWGCEGLVYAHRLTRGYALATYKSTYRSYEIHVNTNILKVISGIYAKLRYCDIYLHIRRIEYSATARDSNYTQTNCCVLVHDALHIPLAHSALRSHWSCGFCRTKGTAFVCR